jgi:hypothetical protein
VCALPVLAAAVVLLLPEEQQQAMLAKVPEGAGGWAVAAVVSFASMALLAWAALPLIHHASGWLRGRWMGLAERPLGTRVALSPLQAGIELLWLFFQALFAVDAFLIILAAFLGFVFVIRIVEPGILPGIAQGLGGP